MFKSVFAKYITAFMVIITVSFAVLIGIISTVVNNYSVNAKADLVAQSAHTAAAYIEEKLQQAMTALYSLADGNRLIGIISHVAELKAEIDNQIIITKEKSGGSKVKIITG